MRLAVFVAIIAAAALFDFYSQKNGIEFQVTKNQKQDQTSEKGNVQLFSQTIDWGVKVQVMKPLFRKYQERTHTKLIQQFHQLRNFQVLKAEVQTRTAPLILSYQFLAFSTYYYSSPDDYSISA